MATDFGPKIAINAYKCISVRDNENVISYNRGFSWSANPKKIFCGGKGLRNVAMSTKFWPK